MAQRGVTALEVELVLAEGWPAIDTRPGTKARVFVFPFAAEWQGRFYDEKEVAVYFKELGEERVLLTVMARYGRGFPRGGSR